TKTSSKHIRLAAREETCRRGKQRECCDHRTGHEPRHRRREHPRKRRNGQDSGTDHVRKPRRPRVLQLPFPKEWLHDLEVDKTGKAETTTEQQPNRKLGSEHGKQPPPAKHKRSNRERPDHSLIEARSP